MFNNQNVGERGVSRPFVVGLILLLLFLSTSQDWSNSSRSPRGDPLGVRSAQDLSKEVRENLIHRLTIENDKLEQENSNLLQENLHLRHAARAFQRGKNGTKILDLAGISLTKDPGDSEPNAAVNVTDALPENSTKSVGDGGNA